ncbi:hypothetical protein K435DRAFT_856952 [Dendrothele bispora CBS 962.96]|uniref:NTF2-domain-containing protein n=1 Tax=Dendrothele bispora (strain CBS 962.96) TaxID=1314807 RepID=A0A4S8M740_DENBC|nr:hypothetical protein K435DRAFT_856952 [Dendrothele bispora CBS 962.96]
MTGTTPQPSEVGWQFVPQYYQFVNKEPERLHCFYGKSSTFVHGTEGEDAQTCHGQQEIHAQITKIGFQDCKIFIHSVDAQSSANNGIVIQVIGEMSNKDESVWRKFVQTFFLAEQPNGYFVLNDIFRFIREDTVDDEVAEEEVPEVDVPATPEPVPEPAAAPPVPPVAELKEPPPPAVVDTTAAPVEEPPTTVSDIDVPVQTPTPAPEPQPVSQPNGVHHEVEKPSPSPAPVSKSPAPPAPAVPVAATPPPQPPAPATAPPPVAAAAPPPPAPQAAPQPVQPAAPPQPKTWANLAAANSKKWGSAVAQESRGTTENVPSTPTGGSGTHTPQNAPSTPVGPRGGSPHPAYAAAQTVSIPQCFIKSVGENVTEAALKTALQRFGPVKSVEIVRSKACAFAEFNSVEAAKRAIIASLSTNAGGEGGLKVEAEGGSVKVIVETKRERADRPPARGRPAFGEGRGAGGEGRGGGSGFRGSRGGGSARGRGGGK